MIRATSSIDGPAFTVSATVSGLAGYLDNWAVIDLAEADPLRTELDRNKIVSVETSIDAAVAAKFRYVRP